MTGLASLSDVLAAEALSTLRLPAALGGAELPLASPATVEEWTELARFAAAERLALLPVGSATKLGWTNPPARADLAVSTRRFAGVVSYEPGDGTLTARAGSDLAALRATVAAGGHHLSPAVAGAAGVTLGGVLAAGQSGFDRLRCGPARHNVLGVRALLADGRVARSGGALVKNVTGYDLHRLYVGSHGTLCVLLEASLRLWPAPAELSVARAVHADRAAALAAARAVLALPAKPLAVLAEGAGGAAAEWTVTVVLAGRAELVRWEEERVAAALPGLVLLRGADGPAAAEAVREAEGARSADGLPSIHVSAPPSRVDALLARLLEHARAAGCSVRARVHPGIATADLTLSAAGAVDLARLLEARALVSGPERLRWRDLPAPHATRVDALGPAGAGRALMERLRSSLDPDGLFARGRFHDRL